MKVAWRCVVIGLALSACSLLTPDDDEYLGGGASGVGGASAGSGGLMTGGSSGSSGSAGKGASGGAVDGGTGGAPDSGPGGAAGSSAGNGGSGGSSGSGGAGGAAGSGGIAGSGGSGGSAGGTTVECDGQTCAPTQYCCADIGNGSGTCTSYVLENCDGLELTCDGPEDCQNGQVCCLREAQPAAECATLNACANGYVVCKDATQCAGSENCQSLGQVLPPEYRICI